MQALMTFAEALVGLEDLRDKLPVGLKPELDGILDGLKARTEPLRGEHPVALRAGPLLKNA